MIAISDGVALYAGNLTLTDTMLKGEGFIDSRLNNANCQLIDVPTPYPWVGGGYTWDGSTLTLSQTVKEQLLSEIVATKRNQINDERNEALSDSTAKVAVGGVEFDADPLSVRQLTEAITLFTHSGVPTGFEWRDSNNVMQPADMTYLVDIAAAMGARIQAIWQTSWARKAALEAIDITDVAKSYQELEQLIQAV